jgi:hypothetical protein
MQRLEQEGRVGEAEYSYGKNLSYLEVKPRRAREGTIGWRRM